MTSPAQHAPQQLSFGARAGAAIGALALIAGTVAFAGNASEHAVQVAEAAINPAIRYIVLPTVEVIAAKQAGDAADVAACVAPHAAAGQI